MIVYRHGFVRQKDIAEITHHFTDRALKGMSSRLLIRRLATFWARRTVLWSRCVHKLDTITFCEVYRAVGSDRFSDAIATDFANSIWRTALPIIIEAFDLSYRANATLRIQSHCYVDH
jgi:hypothetical protein